MNSYIYIDAPRDQPSLRSRCRTACSGGGTGSAISRRGGTSRAWASRDGPYAETKDIIMGFTLVEARDLDQAIKLTETWPGFDEGGCIEVRPVLKL